MQGAKLAGEIPEGFVTDLILMDVTPLSLSIETIGGIATKIIDRNTTIPTRHTQIFSTAANFQTSVDIKVLQGERQFSRDNKLLGNFRLTGIRRAPAGVPQIEVTFDIDANGIVNVSAKDLGTGKEKSITITSSANMSEEEIQQAIHEAKSYAADDQTRKKRFDAVAEAKRISAQAQNYLRENKKDLERDVRRELQRQTALLERLSRRKAENLSEEELQEIEQETNVLKDMLK